MSRGRPDAGPRPRVVRTPYGWDCRIPDEEQEVPIWRAAHEPKHRRTWMAWAAVPLVAAGIGLVFWHPFLSSDGSVAARNPSAATAPAQVKIEVPPSASSGATASPSDAATPGSTTTAPPAATAPPAPGAPPGAPVQLSGSYSNQGGSTSTTCNGGASGRASCQWKVTVPATSSVQYDLTWRQSGTLAMRITTLGGEVLYTNQNNINTMRAVVRNQPQVLVTISVVSGSREDFTLSLSMVQ